MSKKKSIGILSTSRADYSIYFPLLNYLKDSSEFLYKVIAMGMHSSDLFGHTSNMIKSDGFELIEAKDTLVYGDTNNGISMNMGNTTMEMSEILKKNKFDVIVCLGDRYEMFAAVSAVIPFRIPVVHLHGGELTEGAIDQKFRNAITKMADYHLVSCEKYFNRIIQMGVQKNRVRNIGSLGIESLKMQKILSKDQILEKYKIDFNKPTILCTFHPVTVNPELSEQYARDLVSSFEALDSYQIVLTQTNADNSGQIIAQYLNQFQQKNSSRVFYINNLGREGYSSFMQHSSLMIGNSSSGIIEAATFNLPVVNIGDRQKGRETSQNVIHCEHNVKAITEAVKKAGDLIGKTFTNIYEGKKPTLDVVELLKQELSIDYSFCDIEV